MRKLWYARLFISLILLIVKFRIQVKITFSQIKPQYDCDSTLLQPNVLGLVALLPTEANLK